MYCRNCGKEVAEQAVMCVSCGCPPKSGKKFCQNCGAETNSLAEMCVKCGVKLSVSTPKVAKSKLVAGILALFLGWIGVHKFYLGEKGILYLLFCWTAIPMIMGLIDAIGYFTMSEDAFAQKYS